ncbi:hypothetical protein K439DRAFT_1621682 [Ramaria rubella]|nr:hypothetical protein K439DRAFT_1621682 [Ramaria rubella]
MPKPKDSTMTKKSVGRPCKQQKTTAKPAKISDPSKAASVAFSERPKPPHIYNITNSSSSSSAQTVSTKLSNSTTNNDDGDYEEARKAEAALVMMGMARMSSVMERLSEDVQELGVRNGSTVEKRKIQLHLMHTQTHLNQLAQFKIAEKMNIATGRLNIGYKFSTDKVKDPFHALASPVQWLELIEKANIANIPNPESKAKKTITFGVILKDFTADLKGGKDGWKGVKDATGNH